MAALDSRALAVLRRPVEDELAEDPQHAKPRLVAAQVDLHEAVASEGLNQLERPVLVEPGDVRGRAARPAVDEHREGVEH